MKKNGLLLAIAIIFNILSVNAQPLSKYIGFGDSIHVVPDIPDNTDSISILLTIWSPTNTEKIAGIDVKSIIGNVVEASACYAPSIAQAPKNLTEWIKLSPLPTGVYTLRFVAYSGYHDCIYTDSVVAEYSFEVSGQPFISIYPNPSDGDLYLNIYGKKVNGIRLVDISGRKIKEINPTEKYFNIKNLVSGMYILEIHADSEVYRKKIYKR